MTPEYLRLRQRVKEVRDEQTADAEYVAAGLYGAVKPEDIQDGGWVFWIKCKGASQHAIVHISHH
jgi:hypothetical protein